MNSEYYKDLKVYEDWEFHKEAVLSLVADADRTTINHAIDIVEKYHNTPRTLYLGNYNRHPLRVARILMEEFNVKNPRAVLIALCHDLGEWSDYDVNDLAKEFGADVQAGVEMLTWKEGDTWDAFFQKVISSSNQELIKVKMADKLDNNRSAVFATVEEKQKAIDKTENILRPFVLKQYPEYWKKFEESLKALI